MSPIYWVYGLIDPRDGWVFYVGVSMNVERRFNAHLSDKSSAAYDACQEIIGRGLRPQRCIFMGTLDKKAALHLERHLIIGIPQTMNKTLWNEGYKFWESTRERLRKIFTADEMIQMGHQSDAPKP